MSISICKIREILNINIRSFTVFLHKLRLAVAVPRLGEITSYPHPLLQLPKQKFSILLNSSEGVSCA